MKRIAILAGGGRLPLILADSIAASGGRAHIVAVRGEAGSEVEAYPHTWITWGSVNAILATLKRESDGTMMIAGTVSRPDLRRLKPDFGLIRYLPQVLAMLKGGDDAVLTRLIRFFEGQGLTVKGVSDVAPQLLAEPGTLGAHAPQSAHATDDIALGFRVLDALADLDVGQAIAVEGGCILAVEGVEGTDRMLSRITSLPDRAAMPGVLVKGPKRGQDLRVDVPTVGAQTIEKLAQARLGTLVIVAGKTLLLERTEMLRRAVESSVTIQSVDRDAAAQFSAHAPPRSTLSRTGTMLGRIAPGAADSRDAQTAAIVTQRLLPYAAGRASAVTRDHVLAVSAAEGPVAMAQRVASLRQWGRNRTGRGAAAVTFDPLRDDPAELTAMIEALRSAGLAGLAIVRAMPSDTKSSNHEVPAAVVAAADKYNLFLVEIKTAESQPAIEAA